MAKEYIRGQVTAFTTEESEALTIELWTSDGPPEAFPGDLPVELIEQWSTGPEERLPDGLLAIARSDGDGRFQLDRDAVDGHETVYVRVFGGATRLVGVKTTIDRRAAGPDLEVAVEHPREGAERSRFPSRETAATTALMASLAGCSGIFDDEETPAASTATDPTNTPQTPDEPSTGTPAPTRTPSATSTRSPTETPTSTIPDVEVPTEPRETSTPTPTPEPPSGADSPTNPEIREPDPPEPDLTTVSTVNDRSEFLYTGENPVQRDVNPEDIEERRVSTFSGRVIDRDGSPLPRVTVRANGRPEFGWTATREDGSYDMVVNGGGRVTLEFAKEGYLPAQRSVNLAWNEETTIEDVALVQPDGEGTDIEFDTDEAQVVEGGMVEDDDGKRQVVVLIPPKTAAMWSDDGTAPQSLRIRTAEYTVGERGPEAMPAELPPTVAYTYATEFFAESLTGDTPTSSATSVPTTNGGESTTETPTGSRSDTTNSTETDGQSGTQSDGSDQRAFIGAGNGGDLEFDRPVIFYLENFLEFPVGTAVPVGYYDQNVERWIPSTDGSILKIIGIEDGKAVLDLDGDGTRADGETLSNAGISEVEREKLAELYDSGQELWRTPLPHFSPVDCNWPGGLPPEAKSPDPPDPKPPEDPDPCPE